MPSWSVDIPSLQSPTTMQAQPDYLGRAGDFESIDGATYTEPLYNIDSALLLTDSQSALFYYFHETECLHGTRWFDADGFESLLGFPSSRMLFQFRESPTYKHEALDVQRVSVKLLARLSDNQPSIYSTSWPDIAQLSVNAERKPLSTISRFTTNNGYAITHRKTKKIPLIVLGESIIDCKDLGAWHGFYAAVRTNVWFSAPWFNCAQMTGKQARFNEPPQITLSNTTAKIAFSLLSR